MRSSTLPPGLVPVERFQVAFDRDQRCPYCHAGLESDRAALALCMACQTLIHATCAEHHGGCTTRGCARARREGHGSGRAEGRRPDDRSQGPLSPGRRWPLVLTVLLTGTVGWWGGTQVAPWFAGGDPVPPIPVPVRQADVRLLDWRVDQVALDNSTRVAGTIQLFGPADRGGVRVWISDLARWTQSVPVRWGPGSLGPVGDFELPIALLPGQNRLRVTIQYQDRPASTADLEVWGHAPADTRLPLIRIGPTPVDALVSVVAPSVTGDDSLLLRIRVAQSVPQARIEISGPSGEQLTYDAQRPGQTMSVVSLPGPGRHRIGVRVTLPDGRTASAVHLVERR